MSAKNRDQKGRWRNKTIAFRVSKEEDDLLNKLVKISGLTKQEFITNNLFNYQIVVKGNPKVYKALKDEFIKIYNHIRRIDKLGDNSDEFINFMRFVIDVYDRMQYEEKEDKGDKKNEENIIKRA